MNLSARIGAIELTEDEIRLAVVKTGGRLPHVLELHRANMPPHDEDAENGDEAVAAAVSELVARVKARPAAYVLCVPGSVAIVRSLTVPFRGRRVAPAVPFELEPFVAFPIEELATDYCVVRESGSETKVLAVATRADVLKRLVSVLAAGGVRVEGIRLDASGMTALWLAEGKPAPDLRAVLHVREEGSVLAVVQNKSLVFFRFLPLTAESFESNGAAAGRYVQNSLRSFLATWEGEEEVTGLAVTGFEPMPEARMAFEDAVSHDVEYVNLLEPLKGRGLADERVRGTLNRWEAVVSAAHDAAGGPFPLEFCKGELAPPDASRNIATHAVFSVCLALTVGIAYLAYCYMDYRHNVAEVERIGQQVWELYAESFPNSRIVKEEGRHPQDIGGYQSLQFMQQELSEADRGEVFPVEVLHRPPLLAILKELHDKMPPGQVAITEIKIRHDRGAEQIISVAGHVLVDGAFTSIRENLKKPGVMVFDEDPLLSSRDGRTRFRVSGHTVAVTPKPEPPEAPEPATVAAPATQAAENDEPAEPEKNPRPRNAPASEAVPASDDGKDEQAGQPVERE